MSAFVFSNMQTREQLFLLLSMERKQENWDSNTHVCEGI